MNPCYPQRLILIAFQHLQRTASPRIVIAEQIKQKKMLEMAWYPSSILNFFLNHQVEKTFPTSHLRILIDLEVDGSSGACGHFIASVKRRLPRCTIEMSW